MPVNAQALNRHKYRYTLAAEDEAPSIDSIHPFLHYQLARSQYKYMKLAAPAVALLIPFLCPFGPLLTLQLLPVLFSSPTLPLFLS